MQSVIVLTIFKLGVIILIVIMHSVIIFSIFKLGVILQIVIMQSVIMLNVVEPQFFQPKYFDFNFWRISNQVKLSIKRTERPWSL
jgi:hypothetical protein